MFFNPVPGGVLISHQGLGPRRRNWHNGIDISAPRGTLVFSVLPGKVVYAGFQNEYGNTVVLDHTDYGYSYLTVYAHLNQIDVSLDQEVGAGIRIGTVGSTTSLVSADGRPRSETMAPHLHFEVVLAWPLSTRDTSSRLDVLFVMGSAGLVLGRSGLFEYSAPTVVYGPWLTDDVSQVKGYIVEGEEMKSTFGLGTVIAAFVGLIVVGSLIVFGSGNSDTNR